MEQPPKRTEKSLSFQGLREAYSHLDWPKMQLCCMPQLTCFYNPAGFTFAFKMFMFILISYYVYTLYSVYFILCSIPIPFLFILCQGQICFRRSRLSVDSLSSKSSAYFEFFEQELMIITAFSLTVSFDFRQLGRRLVLQDSFM